MTTEAGLPPAIDAALRSVAARLAAAGIEPCYTEARLIFELAGFDRMALIRAPGTALTADQRQIIVAALEERLAGKPVARIRGWVLFDGRRFELSPDTLEPRDDTLTLIDAVTAFVRQHHSCRILDVGTGTGIIGLTLLARAPYARATLTDISQGALLMAQRNGVALQLHGRFETRQADVLQGIEGLFDLIISNPPYIASAAIETLEREVRRHDPLAALDGGADGLAFYRNLAANAATVLAEHGRVAVEIGFDQAETVSALFAEAGFKRLAFHRDLAQRPRAFVFSRS